MNGLEEITAALGRAAVLGAPLLIATLGEIYAERSGVANLGVEGMMAMGALVAMREHGVKVPEEIALIGFDDIPAARILTPSLTTVSQFPQRLGRRAAELLMDQLESNTPIPPRHVELPFELIVRESA